MNISNIAFIAFVVSISTYNQVSSFTIRPCAVAPTQVSALKLYSPNNASSANKNVAVFGTANSMHREEVDLESLTIPQLKQMHMELEKLNEACTEDATQTNAECDVEVKDEREFSDDPNSKSIIRT